MGILLSDLLRMSCFESSKLVAGTVEGREIYVTGITIVEAPDIANWIRGGELLLTSFYSIDKDVDIQKEMVKKLSEKGAAALIIKTSRFLKSIPREVIILGEKLNFPIIEIPGDIKYIDIMYPVMAEIFDEQVNRLNYYKDCHEKFTELTLNMKGKESIAQTLGTLVKNPVIIFDNKFNPKVWSDEKYKDINILENRLKNLVKGNYPLYGLRVKIPGNDQKSYMMITEPVQILNQIEGYIGIIEINKKIEDMYFIALESAATTLKIEMLKARTIKEVELKYKGDLMDDLIHNKIDSIKNIHARSELLGWNLRRQFVVVLINIRGYENCIGKEKDLTESIHLLREEIKKIIDRVSYYYTTDSISSNRGDKIIILWPVEGNKELSIVYKKIKEFNKEFKKVINEEIGNISATMGVGGLAKDLTEIGKSYSEAKDAIKYGGRIFGKNTITIFDELGIYKLLCSYEDREKLKEFVHPALIKLYEYDKDKNNELIDTLEMYLKCNLNAVKTAEELFVHYKTVLYRLNRIKEITNLDMGDRKNILEIEIGLKIMRIIN